MNLPVCRICYEIEDSHNPLLSPCNCKGTIEFIHTNCFYKWLHVSSEYSCKLCNTVYSIEELQLESLYEPSYHQLWLSRHSVIVYINLILIYICYNLYTESYSTQYYTEFYKLLVPPFIVSLGIQCTIIIPSIMLIHNKLTYVQAFCSCTRLPGMNISAFTYSLLILIGFVVSFYYIMGSFTLVFFIGRFYTIHSQIVLQMNTDKIQARIV